MVILPAIDLKDGKCVRLVKGEFDTVQTVSEYPKETAKKFVEQGAKFIHVVDLDGALTGKIVNTTAIWDILLCGARVELGGGIRNMEAVDRCFAIGVSRVILGSAALKDKKFVEEAVKKYGSRIAVGIDAKNGFVSVEGWQEVSNIHFLDLAREMEKIGVKHIIFTDIGRDGTLEGPNLKPLKQLKETVSCSIIASGGIRDIENIRSLAEIGVDGAIAGKSVYAGTLNLKEAIEEVGGQQC